MTSATPKNRLQMKEKTLLKRPWYFTALDRNMAYLRNFISGSTFSKTLTRLLIGWAAHPYEKSTTFYPTSLARRQRITLQESNMNPFTNC